MTYWVQLSNGHYLRIAEMDNSRRPHILISDSEDGEYPNYHLARIYTDRVDAISHAENGLADLLRGIGQPAGTEADQNEHDF